MFDSDHSERDRIHAHIKRLRIRLTEETDGRFSIIAIRGLGYRLADNDDRRLASLRGECRHEGLWI
jgi:DNA-binding response OmpR family regulator